MKILPALFACLLCIVAQAQQKNYLQYHRQIIEAEEYFLDGYIPKSLEKYRQTFEQYKPFAKDCFVALQLSCASNDTTMAGYMVKKAFERGVSWKMLEEINKIKMYLRAHPDHRDAWARLYKTERDKYLASLAWDIRANIKSMIFRDGSYKMIPFAYKTKVIQDSMYVKVLDKNILELIEIIKTRGMPGEHIIGPCDDELDHLEDNYIRLSALIDIMFFHHPYGYHLLKKELMDAVINGEIQPREYALIHDWSYASLQRAEKWNQMSDSMKHRLKWNVHKYSVTAPVVKDDNIYNIYIKPEYHSQDTAFVNKCRHELAIASLQHDERKKKYAAEQQLILFFGMSKNY